MLHKKYSFTPWVKCSKGRMHSSSSKRLQRERDWWEFSADVCPGTAGVQAAEEWTLLVHSDAISHHLSFELFLSECSELWLISFNFMQIFILLQKCPETNQVPPLVYPEQCWKILWESLFSNPTLKIASISRKHILFFFFFFSFKKHFPSPIFWTAPFWHFVSIFLNSITTHHCQYWILK